MFDQTVQFLTPEDSAEVDKALLTSPEKFLARLTISTAKLLSYIAQDLETSVESLTTQQIVRWLEQDAKVKRPSRASGRGCEASTGRTLIGDQLRAFVRKGDVRYGLGVAVCRS